MSHWSRLGTANITSASAFKKAAKELGFTDIRESVSVKDYAGKPQKVDVAARAPGARYDLTLQKRADGKFDLSADFWGIRGERNYYPKLRDAHTDAAVAGLVIQATTKHTLIDTYRRQGFIPRVVENKDGSQTLTLEAA